MWGNPLKPPKPPKPTVTKEKTEKELPSFKPEKPTLPKSEAKKILFYSGNLSHSQVLWTQRWLEQKLRESSLPPQFAKDDAFGQIVAFLSPAAAFELLSAIREDFQKTLPPEDKEADDFDFLLGLANEAYHEHLPPPQVSSRSSRRLDDDPESD